MTYPIDLIEHPKAPKGASPMFELPSSLLQSFTAMSGILCLSMGIAVVWTNPQRVVNQAYAIATLFFSSWLACVYVSMKAGEIIKYGGQADIAFWLRANCAVSALFPWTYWLIINAILSNDAKTTLRRSLPWLIFGLLFVPVCFLDPFIKIATSVADHRRGFPYYIYTSSAIAAYIIGLTKSIRLVRAESGIRRVEIQFVAMIMGIALTSICLLNIAGNAFNVRSLNRTSILLIPASGLLTACALGYHRIFDARLIFLSICQFLGTAIFLSIGILTTWFLLPSTMPFEGRLLVSSLITGVATFLFEHKLRAILQPSEDFSLAQGRRDVMKAAREETDVKKLCATFEHLLCAQCGVDRVELHFAGEIKPGGAAVTMITTFDIAHSGWREAGWISPESLERLRPSRASNEIKQFFADHSIALVVAVPCMSTSPSLIAAFGLKRNRWPFTYPEIQRITKLVETMDSVLTHARVVSQALLKARMGHLALMSRGLAHDLKNLITPVSSFLIHAENKLPLDEVETDVHAAAKRSVRIMTEYVQESLSFITTSEPCLERTTVMQILQAVQEVTATRAQRRKVCLKSSIAFDSEIFADAVLLQRMLANLVCNAIDASAPDSLVSLHVTTEKQNMLRFRVIDEGAGIAAEHLERVFEPYFTTKEYGEELRGFGLGLTIAQQIAHLHYGTIKIESEPNKGTTATVDLPLDRLALSPRRSVSHESPATSNLQLA